MSNPAAQRPRRGHGRGGDAGARSLLSRVSFALRVLGVFVAVEVGLRTTRLPALCARLGLALADGAAVPTRPTAATSYADAQRVVRAVDRVSRRWPLGDTCLRRCLVLGRLLRTASPVLVLGVRRDEAGAIVAHSWLEIAGRAIDPSARDYGELRVA